MNGRTRVRGHGQTARKANRPFGAQGKQECLCHCLVLSSWGRVRTSNDARFRKRPLQAFNTIFLQGLKPHFISELYVGLKLRPLKKNAALDLVGDDVGSAIGAAKEAISFVIADDLLGGGIEAQ